MVFHSFVCFVYFSDTKTLVHDNNATTMPVIVKSSSQQQMQTTECTTELTSQTTEKSPNILPMTMANPYENKNERGKAFRQVLAAVIANLGNLPLRIAI